MKKLILIISTIIFTATNAAGLSEFLDRDKLKALHNGEQVVVEIEAPKGSWPIIRVYQLIDSDPLTSMAIFYAINYQTAYVPNVIKADIVKTPSSIETWVAYELKMPWPIPNSLYTHAHKLEAKNNHYKVKWWMVESTSAEKVEGMAIFSDYKGKTILSYENYVIPKSFLAPLVKGSMVSDVKKSLSAIKEEIEKLPSKDPNKTSLFKSLITDALDGKIVYKVKD